jgi:hypothetical protein
MALNKLKMVQHGSKTTPEEADEFEERFGVIRIEELEV